MTQLIAEIGRDHYLTKMSTRNIEMIADEPVPHGTDQGGTPYDYLLGAIGACVCMTVRMYADRKEWPVESIRVELSQDRIYAKDCEACESTDGFVHIIQKKLSFTGDLDEKQIQRLVQIADKCPVHKTLSNEIRIETQLL